MHPEHVDWLRGFAKHIGGWPTHYLVLDIESTGFAKTDRPWEIGWTTSADRTILNSGDTQIRLSADPHIDTWRVQQSLLRTRQVMLDKGCQDWRVVSWDWLNLHGEHPVQVYHNLLELLRTLQSNGYWLAGHNIRRFDLPRLAEQLTLHTGTTVMPWDMAQVLDTQALFFALQLGIKPGRDLARWYQQLQRTSQSAARSNQDHCLAMLGLPGSTAHRARGDTEQGFQIVEACHTLITT